MSLEYILIVSGVIGTGYFLRNTAIVKSLINSIKSRFTSNEYGQYLLLQNAEENVKFKLESIKEAVEEDKIEIEDITKRISEIENDIAINGKNDLLEQELNVLKETQEKLLMMIKERYVAIEKLENEEMPQIIRDINIAKMKLESNRLLGKHKKKMKEIENINNTWTQQAVSKISSKYKNK